MTLNFLFQSRTDFLQLMINAKRGVDIQDIGKDADLDESTGAKRNEKSERLSKKI